MPQILTRWNVSSTRDKTGIKKRPHSHTVTASALEMTSLSICPFSRRFFTSVNRRKSQLFILRGKTVLFNFEARGPVCLEREVSMHMAAGTKHVHATLS